MFTLSVPAKIYTKTLAFGLHQAINNHCLNEFLGLNDLTQVSEIFNINIEQTSVLGSLALNKNNEGISILLNMGAIPINKSYPRYGRAISDIGLILEHCSQDIYHLAIDKLPINKMSTKVLHEIFIDIFDKVDGDLKCKYFLSKIPIDRLNEIMNYEFYGHNNLFRIANNLYRKSNNTIGFQVLFEYVINLEALLDHDDDTRLKDILASDNVLNELYKSYQIEVKEPNGE
jgi:hypothetical protein